MPVNCMTTFYNKLRDSKKRISWVLDDQNQIRGTLKKSKTSDKCFCPLTAVHYCETKKYIDTSDVQQTCFGNELPDAMQETIKLRGRHRDRIIAAADDDTYHDYDGEHNPTNVRRKMLEVLGLN